MSDANGSWLFPWKNWEVYRWRYSRLAIFCHRVSLFSRLVERRWEPECNRMGIGLSWEVAGIVWSINE